MTTAAAPTPKVTVIPVKPKARLSQNSQTSQQAAQVQKLRVAAYCRVSTDHEEQETSYEAQCAHYKEFISGNPEWELAGIYADEGISGLAASKRPEFKQLIADCMSGKVQMVITKSISRFARNTLDCLNYIRKLKEKGIPILFEKENILTTDTKGEILVTIMASIAQQESASISQNVQMGVRYHYQQGKVGAGHHRFLGFERTDDASLRIVPEEAPIVRRIFREYIEGRSPMQIARGLTEDHVTWRWNKEGVWSWSHIRYLLENEKYTGTLLLQKYYTVDYLTKKVAKNNGEVPQYLVENNHPPIIPQEVFLQTKAQMVRQGSLHDAAFVSVEKHYAAPRISMFLSGRFVCGICGHSYCRKKEGKRIVWRCGTNLLRKYKGQHCDGRAIDENDVFDAIVEALNRLPEEEMNLVRLDERIRWGALQQLDQSIAANEKQLEEQPEGADNSQLKLQNTALVSKRAEYAVRLLDIHNALEKIRSLRGEDLSVNETDPSCSDYEDFLRRTNTDKRVGKVTEYTDYEAFRYVEKIITHPDRLEIVFKAGVSIDVKR